MGVTLTLRRGPTQCLASCAGCLLSWLSFCAPPLSVGAASKYTKVEQLTLRERLARINTHTLSKKTTRLSQLLKQEAGLVLRVSMGRRKGHISRDLQVCAGSGVRVLRPLSETRKLRLREGMTYQH